MRPHLCASNSAPTPRAPPCPQVYDSFLTYWGTTLAANPQAVYVRDTSAKDEFCGGHAVAVGGYDNSNWYWIVKNSCEIHVHHYTQEYVLPPARADCIHVCRLCAASCL